MAGIDKIYGNSTQWTELWSWLSLNRPQYCRFMYNPFGYDDPDHRPISNFPAYADRWLWDNCPIKWVKKRLENQYNGKRP